MLRIISLGALLSAFVFASCNQNPYRDGEALYKTQCANCHMDDGIGLGALMPPLAGSDYLKNNKNLLPCILVNGLADTITVNGKIYAEKMPGIPTLSAVEVTNVLNYINNAWGNNYGVYTLEEVRQTLESCK